VRQRAVFMVTDPVWRRGLHLPPPLAPSSRNSRALRRPETKRSGGEKQGRAAGASKLVAAEGVESRRGKRRGGSSRSGQRHGGRGATCQSPEVGRRKAQTKGAIE
jgi:hypothetical protein